MKFTVEQIAALLEGEIIGNPQEEVYKLAKIEEGTKGALTFLANPKYKNYIYTTQASATIVSKDFQVEKPIQTTLIKVEDAYIAFSKLLEHYNSVKLNKTGIENPVYVAQSASYGENVYLGAFAYLGENVELGNNVKVYPNAYLGDNVKIGDNTTIYAGCKIMSDTVIGKSCIIHGGAVLGADGFGYATAENGVLNKVPQTGNVLIEDDVEIGAGTTIDRATLGSTIIRKGVKLDNQIQVAHNVEIGDHTIIAGQSGIAGSTKIGKNCRIGGQVGIVGHIIIGNEVMIQAQSAVTRNVKDGEKLWGTPAFHHADYKKSYVLFRNLPKLASVVNKLEKKLNNE